MPLVLSLRMESGCICTIAILPASDWETESFSGICGLAMQPWKESEVLEISYLFNKAYWHKGFATEAARACRKYAFETLRVEEVCSIIRDTNIPSQNVALRNGMTKVDSGIKHFKGIEVLHWRYVVGRQDILICGENNECRI